MALNLNRIRVMRSLEGSNDDGTWVWGLGFPYFFEWYSELRLDTLLDSTETHGDTGIYTLKITLSSRHEQDASSACSQAYTLSELLF